MAAMLRIGRFTRITKREARKLFNEGKPFYMCPHKMSPDRPWSMAALITSEEWNKTAKAIGDKCDAWDMMYRYWVHYNASHECGYYPWYYIETESK